MRAPLDAGAEAGPAGSSARVIARYLISLRPILADACAARNEWVRRLGLLLGEARGGDAGRVARLAGSLGIEYGEAFRHARARIQVMSAPAECSVCHAAVRAWVEALQRSCDGLALVGRTGQMSGLRAAQSALIDARTHAHRFNEEYAEISADLRRRVAIARRRDHHLPARRQAQPS